MMAFDDYDEGYDDVMLDGDYDDSRYNSDPAYRDGADDAMEEMTESGEDW